MVRMLATSSRFIVHPCELQYIGNVAKPQLVKNAKNTIIGFRNLLGKKCAVRRTLFDARS